MWRHGPSWLIQPEDLWPRQKSLVPTIETCEEERKVAVMTIAVNEPCGIERVVEINKYGTLRKLYRVTAWVTRFCHNISRRNKSDKREGALTLEEIVESEELWIRMAQRELRKGENYQQLVSKFGLQEDQKGVIRCKGRLEYSEMVHETKEPIILPKEHRLTILQIQECHHRVLHNGVRSTLVEFCSRFWVPKGRQLVKRVISRCVLCKKIEGRPSTQPPTATLPEFRVRPAPPFSKVGVDFAGPLFVKGRGAQMGKSYFALFTCCVTRAVHLELVEDLSVETFKRCLRRFIARRGIPALIVSDNAKTFKGTEKQLRTLFRHPQVREEMQNHRIEWRFNLERAPWWGGFFERMVGCVKRCLKKVLGNARLTYDELLTVLTEVEATLNSRPLTYDYDNPYEGEVLTPAHLLYGRRLLSLPEEPREEDDETETSYRGRYKYINETLQHFWKGWQREYLTNLRESHDCNAQAIGKAPKVGDVVTVYEEGVKRNGWRMAVVESLIVGKDKEVRGANVRVITKGKAVHLSRPVQKLFPIEIRTETSEISDVPKERVTGPQRRDVPRRSAALDAVWKTRAMVNHPND